MQNVAIGFKNFIALFLLLVSSIIMAPAAKAGSLIWENLGIADEAAFPTGTTSTDASVTTTVNWSLATNGGTIPAAGNDYVSMDLGVTGGHTGYLSLGMDNDAQDINDRIIIEINFDVPVTGVTFDLLDIDANSASWTDAIEVFYDDDGAGSYLNAKGGSFWSLGGVNVAADDETFMDGWEGLAPASDASANILFDFGNQPVQRIRIEYFSGDDGAANPGAQLAGLSDIFYNDPPILTLVKSVTNDDGRSATATDWTLNYTDGGNFSGSGTSGGASITNVAVPQGTYTLTETGGPSLYNLTGISCVGGADGDGADGLTLDTGENVTCTFNNDDVPPAPAMTLDKSSPDTSYNAVNDTLNYSYLVTNTGNEAISALTVSDDRISTVNCDLSVVGNNDNIFDPGESVTCTATYTVTQADIDSGSITNNATANGTPALGALTPPTDSHTINANQTITLTNVKSTATLSTDADSSGDITEGDTLEYTVTVTNTGNVTLNNVVVSDAQLTPNSNTCATVAPGATCVLTGDHVVTQAEADAGEVINTASVTSTEVPGPTNSNTVTTPVQQDASLTNVKSAATLTDDADSSSDITAGDTLEYTVTVTNTGNVTLNNVVVSDAQLTPNSNTCAAVAPGATCVLTGDHVVTQAEADAGEVINTASVTSTEVPGPTNSNTVTTAVQQDASLTNVKSAATLSTDADSSGDITEGDTLEYTVTVTNTGNVTLNNVVVSDAQLTPNSNTCATVAPGATCVLTGDHVVTQAEADAGEVINTASVTSTEVPGPTNSNTVTTAVQQDADLTLVKPAPANADEDSSGDLSLGDTLTYTITATNTGNITLTNVIVSDPLLSPNSTTCPSVAPGDSCVLTGNYTVTQSDVDSGSVDNTADVVSNEITTPVQASNSTPTGQSAALVIDKPAPSNLDEDGSLNVSLGDTLTYTITATNTGTITQTNVMVSDPMLTPDLETCASVAPGGTCVLTGNYTVTQADVDNGSIDNTAAVASVQISSPVIANQSEPVAQTDDLSIVKPAPANADGDGSGDISVGDVLTYTITATNSGTTTLNNVVVSDNLISPNSNTCATLAPGATCVLTGTYTVTQADIDNGAIDNTAGVVSNEITTPVEASNTSTPNIVDDLAIVKPAPSNADGDGSGDISLGDVLTYTITATNSGTTTLNNVIVSDNLISPNSNSCTTLAPGATCVLTGSYTVTQADVDAGTITNTAGVVSDEITTAVEDTNTSNTGQTDDLSIVKPAPANADGDGSGDISVGDVLTYTITATNSGTTTLNNVIVSDNLISPNSNTCTTLAPGATCVLTGTYTVTQADVDAGAINNTAGVVSDEITTPVEASNTSTPNQTDDLTIVKPAPANADEDSSGDVSLGDTLTYTITATNAGTTTLNNVVVSDNLISPNSNTCATLAPGATCVLTGTYSVTQTDVDNGSIANTAGVTSNEITTPVEASNTTNTGQNDALSIVKPAPNNADGDGSGDISVGDVLTYTITATNSGTTTLSNVVVTDNLISPNSNTCATLAPGATCVLSGTYTVTQADIDNGSIVNTAGVVSNEITTPVEATNTSTPNIVDDLSIVKPAPANADEDSSGDVSLGDTLTYSITATNSGTTTLSNVVVSDNLISPNSNSCATLAPGATCILTGTYSVTQADVDNGSIANTAGVLSNEITTPVEATNTTNTGQNDDLSIVKPAPANADEDGSADVSLGDTLTYTITATNSGTTTLTNVVVSDNLISPNSNTCATLAPGAICVLTGTYSVTQTDVDNGSIANTAGVVSNEITTPVEATNTTNTAQTDALSIIKPAPANADEDGSGDVSLGDTLTYTITATNSGTTTLTNVMVNDAMITPSNELCATLAPSATCVLTGTYTVTQTDVDNGTIDNTAMVASVEISTPETANQSQPVGQTDALSIAKPAPANADEDGSGDVSVGDTLTYTVTATNSGTTTLSNVVVSDTLITPNSNTCATLAPGATCVLTGTYTVTQTDVDNGSIVNTAGVVSNEITTPEEATNTTVTGQNEALSIVKPAPVNGDQDSSGDISVGDVLTYTITATNSGTTTLTDVTVTDDQISPGFEVCATVAPGATCVLTGIYSVTQADVDAGSIVNTARVISNEIPTAEEAVQTTIISQTDDLTIAKPAPANADEDGSGDVSLGDTLTYTVTATNSGTTTLNNVIVSDPLITPNSNTCATLAPGATCVLSGTYSVTQTDVDNGSIANTASVVSDEITTPVEASNTTNTGQTNDLTIAKPAPANADEDGSGDVSLSDTLTYTVTATNSGTTTLNNVVVSDPLITPNSNTCPTLAPGATCVLNGTYTVTQADVDNGSIANTAGVVSNEITTPVEASNTTNTGQTDDLSIAKPAPANADEDGSGDVSLGDTLTYTVTATNNGTTTLNNVVVSDPLITPNSNSCATLAPGATCVLSGTYSVTQADVDNGSIANTAGVVSNEITTPVEASNTTTTGQTPALSLVKPAPANADEDGSGDISLGDTLTYTVTATNSGTVSLTNVVVSDNLITPNSNTCPTLAVGATCVLTGTYTVTQADVDNGTITNNAEVVSTEVTTPVPATNTSNTGQTPDLTLVKPAPANADEDGSGDISLGDTLTYTVTATNSGTISLTNVVVTDPLITPNSNTCPTLAVGATCVLTGTYTVTQADVDNGSITNNAEVVSTEVTTPVPATNTSTTGQAPALALVKPAPANADEDGSGDVSVGDTLTYTVTATNSGTITLNNVVVSDLLITPNSNTCPTLAVGAICVLTGTYTVTQADIDNGSITNSASVESTEVTTPVTATNTTNGSQTPDLTLAKPAPVNADEDGSGDVSVGDTLTYTITATNSGTITLTNVMVNDAMITPSNELCASVPVSGTCVLTGTYTVTQADVDAGTIDNTAMVASVEIATPVTASNSQPVGQTEALSLVKPAPANADEDGSGDISLGDTLTYTVTATNSGTTTLSNVVVSDALITPNSNTCATLAPGATCVLTGTYTVTQADVDNGSITNNASAVSTEITIPETATNTSNTGQNPALALAKPDPANADEDGSGDISLGDTLTYTVTATNSGTVSLTNVLVSDPLITPSSNSCATLAVGATCVLSGTYSVTQTDVDNGSIANTASVASTEVTTPVTATNTSNTGQTPELSLVKPAPVNADEDGSGDVSIGDTLTYTVTATNSGTITLSNVVVSDPLITPNSITCASLAPGATCVLSGTYTVTQADVDNGSIANTASVASTEVTTPVNTNNTQPVAQNPALTLVKPAPVNGDQDGSGDVSVGDILTYTITATNSGDQTLTNVAVNDNMITPSSNMCTTVAPGATCVLTGTYTVTQADIDSGSVVNNASVSSTEVTTPVTATNTTNTVQTPELSLVKPAPVNADQDGSGDISVGDTLTYTVTATNSGTITLSNVVVSDALITPNSNTCPTLAVGATCVLTGTYTVTQADVDNGTITNNASVASTEVTTPVTATNTSNTGQNPALALIKPAPTNADQDGSGDISLGDTLTYTVTATNSGTITLSNVVVSDPLITPNSNTCATLAPGATCVLSGAYTVTQTDVDTGSIANTASVQSTEVTTAVTATNTSDVAQNAALGLVKDAPTNADEDGSGDVSIGDTLTYTVTATNTGTITLNSVVVSDPLITPNSNSCATLAPGATCVLTGTYTVSQANVDGGSIVNTANVTSTEVTTPVTSTNTQVVAQNPALTLVKPAPVNGDQDGSGDISVGDILTYTVTATNSGDQTLTNVTVSDAMITPGSQVCATVAPGGTCVLTGTYTVTQADIDAGDLTNNASVTSTELTTPVAATNTTTVAQNPDIALDKPAPTNADEDNSGGISLGDTLTYTITATNTGNVTLTNVMVNDPLTTPANRICASVAPGGTCVLSGTYTVTQADVDNGDIVNMARVASVEIATPVTATNTSTAVQTSALSIAKPDPANADEDGTMDVSLQDTLTYTITATNTGTVTLTNVVVTDAMITPSTQTCTTLAPGATCTLSGSYVVAQDDVNAGEIINTANVVSAEVPTAVNATNTQEVAQTIGLVVDKPAPANADEDNSGDVSVGDTLTYTVTARNIGTVFLTNVVVTDAMTTPDSQTCASLAPGGACVLSGTYTVTQADVDAGEIVNTASATSNEVATAIAATNTQNVPQRGAIAVSKTGVVNNGANGYANVDESITYNFAVTNTGTVTLTNVTLDDPLVAVDGGPIATLAPGETDNTTFTATYILTPRDITNGRVVNTARAIAFGPDGAQISGLSDDPSDLNNEDEDNDGNPDDPTITDLLLGPTSIVTPFTVVKTTRFRDVSFGDLVPYEITITNNDDFQRANLTFVDLMPTGFNYAPDTARIDGVAVDPVEVGNRLTFPNQVLDGDEEVTINLVLVVGAGVTEGEYVNQASVESSLSGVLLSEIGEATVIVGPTPVFDCAEVIGKVFDDRNLDGYQNPGEEGIPDVRIATVKGELVTTDAHGRFHVACAEIPNGQIGSNYIMKIDPRSLPTGYRITTENPRVVRLTRGKMTKLNFGATRPRIVTLDLSQQVFIPGRPLLQPAMQPNIAQLMTALKQEQSILRVNYHAVPGEPPALAQDRLQIVADHINHLWEQQACCYDLTIETKMISMGAVGAAGYRP